MNARKLILAALCSVLAVLALSPASASALAIRPYLSQITGFGEPRGVAVDSTGNLYVADVAVRVVDRFDAANAPLNFSASETYIEGSRLTGTPSGPFEAPEGVAVDNATGDIYVTDGGAHHVVDVFGSTGEYLSQLTGTPVSAPVSGAFANPYGVAVDQADGDVYVADLGSSVVDVFNSTNEYVSQFGQGVLTRAESVSINELTGTVYVSDTNKEVVFPFTSTGTPITPAWTGAQTPAKGFGYDFVAVGMDPSNGNLLVASGAYEAVDEFKPSSSEGFLYALSGTAEHPLRPRAVAVSPLNDEVYVAQFSGVVSVYGASVVIPDVAVAAASEAKPHSAILNGTVNPDEAGPVTCVFEYGTSTEYGHSAPCAKAVPSGNSPVAVSAGVSGLEPDTAYHFRLKATNANGTNTSQDQEFRTDGAVVRGVSSVGVAAEAATLQAEIDLDGAVVHAYFQYGTSTSYGSDTPTPPGEEIAGEGVQVGSAHIQGLQPGTTYHFRLIIEAEVKPGEVETLTGGDETFTTQTKDTTVTVPDGRAYELVTPPNKFGAGIIAVGNEQGSDIQASLDGNGITYTATAPIEANSAGNRSLETTQIISTRGAPGVWSTKDIATAHDEGAEDLAVGHSSEYKLFASDLSHGLVEPVGHTPLPPLPEGSEGTIYLREAGGEYKALATAGNVPAGVHFGGKIEFAGASPDLNHIVVDSQVPLSPPTSEAANLYEWSAGQFHPVSVLPNHKLTFGILGSVSGRNVRHAISSDGSHIVWSNGEGAIYIRDTTSEETVQINGGLSGGEFMTASSEGTRVFFTSGDLYVFEQTSGAGEALAGKLTDLTVDSHAGEAAGVGAVLGASEDGSIVYFVAGGVLGNATKPGTNLYVERFDEATKTWSAPTFVAALSGEDSPDELSAVAASGTSRVSPDGRYVTFMSNASLTGYDNEDANSGARDEEVFLYDSATNRLVCASCDPTGAQPVGLLEGNAYEENLVDYSKIWEGKTLAANIPGRTTKDLSHGIYESRVLSSSGRLFFNSNDALVPADVNGKEDVYEYQPSGVGSCQPPGYGESGSVVYNPSAGGCIGLISSGTSTEESAFMDASESGGDVFFLTLSHLSPQDYDTSIDLYDAHECTTAAPCAPAVALAPPPCTTGDACKPGPTPQPTLFGEPASQTFSGAGNVAAGSALAKTAKPKTAAQPRAAKLAKGLRACAKGPKAKRKRCLAQARKKYGPAPKAKKTDRRAK